MAWQLVALWVAATVLSYLLRPKPDTPKAAGLADIDAPIASQDTPIPVLFGSLLLKGPNVVWYGHLASTAIRKGGGLFSSKQTVGYKYYLGLHMSLCHGPADAVTRIDVGDALVWQGNADSNQQIYIDAETIFGGDEREGGIAGGVNIALGGPNQATNDYLIAQLGEPMPAFRGVCSVVCRQVYVGNSAYIKPWAFHLRRIHKAHNGAAQWYDEKAEIRVGAGFDRVQSIYFALDVSPSMDTIVGGGLTRLDVMKAAMADVLQQIDENRIVSGVAVHIGICAWSTGSSTIHRNGVNSATIQELTNFVNGLSSGSGTNFDAPMQAALTWFDSTIMDGRRRTFVFVTDGEPTPLSSVDDAQVTGADLIDQTGGAFNSVDGTQVDIYGINIDLANTQYTELIENTPDDGVPVISGDDVQALSNAIFFGFAPGRAMNPAHIIRECLTNPEWGMGYPEVDMDDTLFEAAADVLHDEGLGLALLWSHQTPVEDFVLEVLRHIDAALYVDIHTGLFCLKLQRDDYITAELPLFDESNIVRIEQYTRSAYGELVNQISVVYRDLKTNNDHTVTLQDMALVNMQGGAVVATTVQYPGISTAGLANRLAARDLAQLSQPLAKATMILNRHGAALNIGAVFRWSWPRYGIQEIVMRVVSLAFGTLQSGQVRVECVQDVFAAVEAVYAEPQPTRWVDPVSPPAPAPQRRLIEAPYWTVRKEVVDTLPAGRGVLLTQASKPSADAIDYQVRARVGTAAFAEQADSPATFTPSADLSAGIDPIETEWSYSGAQDLALVELDNYALINDELVAVRALDQANTTLTVDRGVLDTVPATHASGARVWFAESAQGVLNNRRNDGVTLDVRLLPTTGRGTLALVFAPTDSITFGNRFARPYPPGNFLINGQPYPAQILGDLTVSWAHRDRTQQLDLLVDQAASDIGPETGVTYTVQVRATATASLLFEQTGITDTSIVIPQEDIEASQITVTLFSMRDGLQSFQSHTHTCVQDMSGLEFIFPDGIYTAPDGDAIEFVFED